MKNILFYNSGGGLGDSIQLFPLIISLKNYFKTSNFYYLGAHDNHRYLLGLRRFGKRAGGLKPVHSGHDDVHQDQVKVTAVVRVTSNIFDDFLESFLSIISLVTNGVDLNSDAMLEDNL